MRWPQTGLLATMVAGAVATAPPDHLDIQYPMSAASHDSACSLPGFVSNLSSQAEIYLPGSAEFAQFSERWSNLETPIVNITILPATENDVVKIVSQILSFDR